jgi:hypothetical protein
MISLKKAREKLDMGDTCIRKLIATDPTFPAYFICGRWKVDAQQLDAWIEAKKNKPQPAIVIEAPRRRGRPKNQLYKKPAVVYEVITPGWVPDIGRA